MKARTTLMLLCLIFCPLSTATSAPHDSGAASYQRFAAALSKQRDSGVFVATCRMEDGHEGVLMFPISGKIGYYFELQGSQTLASGSVRLLNGAYEMQVDGSAAALAEKSKRVMKTLVMAPFFFLTPYQLDTITGVAPKQQCFEEEP